MFNLQVVFFFTSFVPFIGFLYLYFQFKAEEEMLSEHLQGHKISYMMEPSAAAIKKRLAYIKGLLRYTEKTENISIYFLK